MSLPTTAAHILREPTCSCSVTRGFEQQPCNKPAVGLLRGVLDGEPYLAPACAWHLNAAGRAAAVPLIDICDFVFTQGHRAHAAKINVSPYARGARS